MKLNITKEQLENIFEKVFNEYDNYTLDHHLKSSLSINILSELEAYEIKKPEKVWVVTVGEYSDLSVEKVISNKALAEKYVKIKNSGGRNYDLYNDPHEYEVFDDDIKEVARGQIQVCFSRDREEDLLNTYIETKSLNVDHDKEELRNYSSWDLINVIYEREIETEEDRKKLLKIQQDIYAQCKALHQLENWTLEMVEEFLKEKFKNLRIS